MARGLVPTLPQHDRTRDWFLAGIIIGASIAPYLFLFYSAGAIEDCWNAEHLAINRVTTAIGLGFGSLISAAVVVVATMVLLPRGIQVDHYAQLALLLIDAMGWRGFALLVASLGIACLGTAVEFAPVLAYMTSQRFGGKAARMCRRVARRASPRCTPWRS